MVHEAENATAPEPESASESAAADSGARLCVSVVRSGGFAGLKRTWEAIPETSDDTSRWLIELDGLPWGSATSRPNAPRPAMPDRFVYRITVVIGVRQTHEVVLPETELQGAWKELVERVKQASA